MSASTAQITTQPETTTVVAEIEHIADDVVSVTLEAPVGARLPGWESGAHVDLVLAPGLERQYSLCGDPADDSRWRIAVLREPESRGGSAFIHERLAAGDEVRVRGPRNNFHLVDATTYRFVAGGIGITPLVPMVRRLTAQGRPWTLLYGGRRAATMAFVDELRALGDQTTFCPEETHGLLDLATYLDGVDRDTAVYCCGPEGLLQAVQRYSAGWPDGVLHVEHFRGDPSLLDAPSDSFEVVVGASGVTVQVEAGQSIIDALATVGVDVETSCLEGTCGTCETNVIEGTPDHRDVVLTESEKQSNTVMMICCSRSKTPRLVLDL
jgi:ferredoxin-NADP reductase